jgi:class 3 adenylate cyclase
MNCPSCQHENPPAAKFCLECGGRLALSCAKCGVQLPPGAKFCLECGASLDTRVLSPVEGRASTNEPLVESSPPYQGGVRGGFESPRQQPPPSPLLGKEGVLPSTFAAGRYQVQRFLGEGAKKRVYLAHDTKLDRDVAFALIKTDGLDADGLVRIRREAQAMGRLGDHPHIVTVFDTGEENGQPYIVSQCMSGGSVERLLQGREHHRLTGDEAVRIGSEVCRALQHAHGRGVVHRDLKPGNVWLSDDGTASLGDFGLAVALDRSRLTMAGMMVGTVAYMAPEQALGRAPDARSDLYALGAMLYEMLTGRPPFLGDDAVAIISQHINTAPVAPAWHNPAVPKALETLVMRLLAKDPEARPESAARVLEALQAIAAAPRADSKTAPVPQAAANPLDRLASGVFVGREHEVQQLRKSFDQVLSGQGHVSLLVGEPGIGKTRTSEELTTYARMRGAQVLWGRCYEGEGAPPYWPWVQIVRSYVHDREPRELLSELGSGAPDIADVVSEVRERLPGLPAATKLEPEQARFRLFDSITTFLKNAANRQPLVLVLDDLHWADKPSLLLLQFLAREQQGSRILLLGTYRDVELRRQHSLSETLAVLAREQHSERIVLRGLSQGDVARFIEMTADMAAPEPLVAAVYRETEGNPFFIHEVVRLLARDGRLQQSAPSASWSVAIPQGIREVIGRRLNQLSEDCNRVLTLASVLGREFDLAVLGRVTDLSEDRVLEVVDEALGARLIEEMPGTVGHHRFAHALVQETLYDELNTTRRVRLHRRIAEALETHYGSQIDRHLAELAHHAVEGAHGGGDVDKAVTYATKAGDRAVALHAYEDAIPHYERALQALELKETPEALAHCDLLLALGHAQRLAADRDRARETLREAVAIARVRSDPLRLARGATGLAWASHVLGLPNEASVALLEEALAAIGDRDCLERVQALDALTMELSLGPTNARAKSVADKAVEVARRLGDPNALVVALNSRFFAYFTPADLDDREASLREMLQHAQAVDDPSWQMSAHGLLRIIAFERGDRAEFEAHYTAEEALLGRTQAGALIYFHHLSTATRALLDANWEEAERLAQAAFARGRRVLGNLAVQMGGVQMAAIMLARDQIEASVAGFEASAGEHVQPAWKCAVAWVYGEAGRVDEARALLRRLCADNFAAIPWDGNWLTAIACLAYAAALVGDPLSAAQLYQALAPYPKRIVHAGAAASLLNSTSYHLGNLARVLGRLDEAAQHFEDSLAVTSRLGARYWAAQTELAYADLLGERDASGDRQRALALVNRALDMGRETNTPSIMRRALESKLRLQRIDSGDTQHSITAVVSQVQRERPDLRSHAAPDGTVTILFSDIEGSTQMTERLGDQRWLQVLREHNRMVREQVAAHGGFEVKSQGDGFMIAFQSARRALLCAVAIQRAFAAYAAAHTDEALRVRIGLHAGEVIKEADDFFGKNVILASRIAAQAQGGEILVSSLVKELTHSSGDIRFDVERRAELKGLSGTYTLHPVSWLTGQSTTQ